MIRRGTSRPLRSRFRRSAGLGAILLLVDSLLMTAAVVLPVLGGAQWAAATTSGCAPGIGTRVPVLKVHGYTGSPAVWDVGYPSMTTALGKLPHLYQASFDYSDANRQWVTDPRIGPALADKIACLAASSRADGGAGKVIVIAHSEGGLATRFAAAQTRDGHRISDLLGLVITLGTPNRGSFLVRGGAVGISEKAFNDLVIAACYTVEAGTTLTGIMQGTGNYCALPNASDSASQAFVPGSEQLSQLSPFPSSVPVRAIAGVIDSVTVPIVYASVSLSGIGDGVVAPDSALFGAAHPELGGGAIVVHCGPWVLSLSPPGCTHGNEPNSPLTIAAVIKGIRVYLGATAPAPLVDLHTLNPNDLTLPTGTCSGNGPVPLSNGVGTTEVGAQPYDVSLPQQQSPAFGDIDGDGHDEESLTVTCTPSGTNSYATQGVVLRAARGPVPTLVGFLNTTATDPEAIYPNLIDSVQLSPGKVTVAESYYTLNDPHSTPSGRQINVWTYLGGALIPTSATRQSPQVDVLSQLAILGMQQCEQHGDPQGSCQGPANPRLSTIDPRYAYAGPTRDGYGGAVFQRSTATATDFSEVLSVGGGAIPCDGQPVRADVLREFELCY